MMPDKKDAVWCSYLCHTLDTLRRTNTFSDVIIFADDRRMLSAHSCVLAAASPVLKTELMTGRRRLRISGISGDTWEAVLSFVYTGEVTGVDDEGMAKLHEACRLLRLRSEFDGEPQASINDTLQQPVIAKDEFGTRVCSGEDVSEPKHNEPDEKNGPVGTPQECATIHQPVDVKDDALDVEMAVEGIQSMDSKIEVVELDSLELDIQALLTQEFEPVELISVAEEVDLAVMHVEQEVVGVETDEQDESYEQKPSSEDDKRKVAKTTGVRRKLKGRPKKEPVETDCDQDESNYQKTVFTDCEDDERNVAKTTGVRRRGRPKTNVEEYPCEICGKLFNHLSRLKFHSNIHTGARPFPCSHCGMTFNHSSNMTRHERTHTGERPHACLECGKRFQRASDMAVHVRRIHCDVKAFACFHCAKTFSMESDLKNHVYSQHNDDKPFTCSICDKSFVRLVNLASHERTHTGERPYACDICGSAFKDSSNLSRHRHIHTGVKPFECTICGKTFHRKADLIGHQRIHTEEKPFICATCGKGFTFRTTLVIHTRIHTGVKPYMCAICGKTFSRNCNLFEHQMTHSGEKPFRCDTCGRSFASKKSLASHERIHSELKPFECHLCGKTFRWACALKKHVPQCPQR